jgi:hypothetical protein
MPRPGKLAMQMGGDAPPGAAAAAATLDESVHPRHAVEQTEHVVLIALRERGKGRGIGFGMVDSLLRPILVGKDTRMPDYVVLLSTLGGLAVFGINGFIIGPVIAAMFIAVWDIYVRERIEPPP